MADEIYCDAKDFRDVNFNMNILIEKFNHEHTRLVDKVVGIEKKVNKIDPMQKDITEIKSGNKSLFLFIKVLCSIIGSIAALVGIGAAFG